MASVRVKFRASTVVGKEGVIYYQVIRNRVIRQITTEYRILSSEWDEKSGQITSSHSKVERCRVLTNIKERINLDVGRLNHIIMDLSLHEANFSAVDVVCSFERELNGETLGGFTLSVINRLRELRRDRGVETYTTTLKSFMRFRSGEDLLLTDITSDLIMSYDAYLKSEGLSMNTISFYIGL